MPSWPLSLTICDLLLTIVRAFAGMTTSFLCLSVAVFPFAFLLFTFSLLSVAPVIDYFSEFSALSVANEKCKTSLSLQLCSGQALSSVEWSQFPRGSKWQRHTGTKLIGLVLTSVLCASVPVDPMLKKQSQFAGLWPETLSTKP